MIGIEIIAPADKLDYKVGEQLDIAGLIVNGIYDDGSRQEEPVTLADISGFDSSSVAETQTLTITIEGHTASYDVSMSKADGKALEGVTADDVANTMIGMTSEMEYSVDGGITWSVYDTNISPNLPPLTGNIILLVRCAETDTHTAGPWETFVFTVHGKILPLGYEAQVRVDMGVTASILPDTDVQSKAVLAEALIIRVVPGYSKLSETSLVFLQSACIAQLCALLCPGMPQRVKIHEQDETLYAYRIQSVNWTSKKREFEGAVRDFITLVLYESGKEYPLPSVMGVVRNDRAEI